MVSHLNQKMRADTISLGEGGFPKLKNIKKNPIAEAIVSKLVREQGTTARGGGKRRDATPSPGYAQKVSDHTAQKITDNTNIFQLLPDTEMAMQVLVSSILSPKDMTNVEMGYKAEDSDLEPEISGEMVEVIRSHFEEVYKIKSVLPEILENVLFIKGSYPILVLPENSVDDVINSDTRMSLESLKGDVLDSSGTVIKSIGLLGSPTTEGNKKSFSMESMFSSNQFHISNEECEIKLDSGSSKAIALNVSVTDNLNVVKFPKILKRLRQEKVQDVLGMRGISNESRSATKRRKSKNKEVEDGVIEKAVYREAQREKAPFLELKTKSQVGKDTQGHPLVMKLPPEAVIPVHVPSNPEDHIGYFVLLDTHGNPINRASESDYYRDLATSVGGEDISSQLLEAGRRASEGHNNSNQANDEEEKVRLYAKVVEKDLMARLKNGVYGDGVEISRPLDVYRIMMARSLANMGTQILYVPAELMTYIAFDYNNFGIGKSLLDDNKILASIRSMLMFSNTMASIKNSTGKTGLKIELDPDDPDPSATVEYMIHEYSRNRQAAYPLGASNPLDIIDFLQNAGIDVQVSGNAAYPETKLEVEDHASNKVNIDTDLEDKIRDRYFMALGISPETIDLSKDVEFATSIVNSNLLLAKRVILYQEKLTYFVKDFIRKYVWNSSDLYSKLIDCLDGKKGKLTSEQKKKSEEQIVEEFLDAFELHLPRPDSAKLENQLEAFRLYTEALEEAVDAYYGEDSFMLREFDDVEEDIRAIRQATIAYYQRRWLSNNNVLPELMGLVTLAEDGKPELDINQMHGEHVKNLGKSVNELIKNLMEQRRKREAELEEHEKKLDEKAEKEAGEGESEGGETDTPVEDDGDSDGAGDEPAEEEPIEETGELDDDSGEEDETEEEDDPDEEEGEESDDDEEEDDGEEDKP